MTDYRALIAPYLNHWRTPSTTGETIKTYTRHLTRSIDFLEAGRYEPDEAFYKALETDLLNGNELEKPLAPSTTKNRVSLACKFFTWTLEQGERLIPMTDIDNSIPNGDEETAKTTFDETGKATAPNNEESVASPNVDTTPQKISDDTNDNPDDVMQPQTQALQESSQATSKKTGGGGRPKKSDEGRTIKLSVYLTPTLDADLQDLARLQRLSTADYIFRLIEKERDRRANALATFRTLVDDE